MVNFDRTRSSFIENKFRDVVEEQRVGKVLTVYEHVEDDDTSNFEADVKVDGDTRLERLTPVIDNSSGSIDVPKVGDSVMVEYRAGESKLPVITGYVNTVSDRPPLGKAGMTRNEFESGKSPAGFGNLYFTGYTSYDKSAANFDKDTLTPEETFVRISKRSELEADPTNEGNIPAKIEFYDAPAKDEAHITVQLDRRDGANVSGSPSWGMRFDFKSGEVKLVDASGYGFVSDGDGNWTWEYESKTENQVSGGGSLSL